VGARTAVYLEGLAHGDQPIPNAARIGPLLATGTVNGRDRATGDVSPDLRTQIARAFGNLSSVLEAGGCTLDDVIKLTVYLADRSARAHINEVWLEHFPTPEDRPARHVIETALPGELQVQIEALAYVAN
jgi:2-iminobutanoate/2-iminopropanoate deaminase